MLKVAVTGASGHIGNCLVRELLKIGAHIKVLVHTFENHLAQLEVEIIRGNILEPETLTSLCKDVDVVFHCAAQISIDSRQPNKVYETNITGTRNMVEASLLSGVKKFIHFSSIDAFENIQASQVLDEKSPLSTSKKPMYDYSKAEGEKIILEAVERGLDAVILCPSAVVGPYDYRGSYLGQALLKMYKNKIPALIPGGYYWVDVRDVVSAAIKSVQSGRKGEKYIISGNYCSLKDLSKIIGKMSGKNPPRLTVPVFLAFLVCPFFEFISTITKKKPMFTCQSLKILISAPSNISLVKSQNELEYIPRPLEETLRDTFDWYKQNKYLN